MFTNVGKKIQKASVILFFVFLLAGLILGIVGISLGARYGCPSWDFFNAAGVFLILFIVCPVIGYLSALIMHGFGTIVSAYESKNTSKELPKDQG